MLPKPFVVKNITFAVEKKLQKRLGYLSNFQKAANSKHLPNRQNSPNLVTLFAREKLTKNVKSYFMYKIVSHFYSGSIKA
jgi:hypothetical protein